MREKFLTVAWFLILTSGPSFAGVITPADFGSQAVVETFDSLPVNGGNGPLVLNDATYSFTPNIYYTVAADPISYLCSAAATCLGFGDSLKITLSTPADKVGGYLSGAGDSPVASLTDILYYDANNVLIGVSHPAPLPNSSSSPMFFGFESAENEIRYIFIKPNAAQAMRTLDNFTAEVVTAVPEPSTWAMMILGLAGMGYMTYRRRKISTLAA